MRRSRTGTASTDRKVGRLRIPGRGRKGNRLVVREGARWGPVLLDHNAADPDRHNGEAVLWIARRIGHRDAWSFLTRWM